MADEYHFLRNAHEGSGLVPICWRLSPDGTVACVLNRGHHDGAHELEWCRDGGHFIAAGSNGCMCGTWPSDRIDELTGLARWFRRYAWRLEQGLPISTEEALLYWARAVDMLGPMDEVPQAEDEAATYHALGLEPLPPPIPQQTSWGAV